MIRITSYNVCYNEVITKELHAYGVAQENLGDINAQSIAGAISTGTHGTGERLGSLATQAVGLTVVTASGEIFECSARQDESYNFV